MTELEATLDHPNYDNPERYPEYDRLDSLTTPRLEEFIDSCDVKIAEITRLKDLALEVRNDRRTF